jgi:hypothetical protein
MGDETLMTVSGLSSNIAYNEGVALRFFAFD